ncbi:MAG: PPC domain-containing protein, partial [Verrucomicrobiota bacterium]
GPLDLWYSETGLPDGTQVGDVPAPQLPWVINTNVPPVLPRGQRYYLGVRNPDPAQTRRFEIRVDFDLAIIPLTNNVPYARTNLVAGLLDYYAFDVSRDATAVEFALTNLTGDANLFVTRGPRLPRPLRYDYAGTNTGTLPELVRIDLASEPVPLDAGRWYLAVAGVSTNPMNYTVLAREVPGQFLRINDGVTNRVTNAVAGGFDYFVIDVPADAERATVRVRPVAGDADLFVKKGVPLPDEFRYDYASAKPDLAEEVVVIDPFSDPMPLRPGRWFAGVQAVGPVPVVYDISVNFVRPAIEDLQNGVPVVRTNFGAAFRHFRLAVPPGAVEARFEVYDILNEADLLVARDALPTNAPRVFSSFLPTTNAESIRLTNTQASLPGDWYLSVVTSNTAPNIYTVRASFLTNPVIPPGTNVTLRILLPVAPSTNGVLEWDSVVGRRYQVEYADAFHAGATVWTALGTPVTAVATVTRVEVPFPDPFRLYRVIDLGGVTPPPPPPPATNLVSLLTLLPDGTNALLAWNSVPARQYQVQFSTDPFVASPVWTAFGTPVTAVSNITSVTVPLPALEPRFYRVLDATGGVLPPPPPPSQPVQALLIPPTPPALDATLEWNSVVGRAYRIQFASDFQGGNTRWQDLGTTVTATTTRSRIAVPAPEGTFRLYRVIDVDGGGGDPVGPPVVPPGQTIAAGFRLAADGRSGVLTFNSVSNRQYQVQSSAAWTGNAASWSSFGGVITAAGPATEVNLPLPGDSFRLYRVVDVTGSGGAVNPPPVTVPDTFARLLWPAAPGQPWVVEINSVAGARYQLQSAADLAAWSDLGPVVPATGTTTRIEVPAAAGEAAFLRVRIVP